jgi:hypothetical protein
VDLLDLSSDSALAAASNGQYCFYGPSHLVSWIDLTVPTGGQCYQR